MIKFKINKVEIDKVYTNKRTGQQFIILPRKKMKESITGKKILVSYW